uniref:NADH-ubiquinone oxidoreductase chain 2 n=1 Tax=Homologenus malayensis TaxID=1505608 RepID=A0A0A7CD27_9EUCA|nr:NADH dehydrogenase subunit 2 [Homologenus malayensis]AIB52341.1 NADH dehydrogenase subunit 2 [Homologenus malayensis]
MFLFHLMFFLSSLLIGSIISISSTSWFTAWIGLELNLMSFIPLISIKPQKQLSEAAIKYFLIQALGSAIIIMSSCLFLNFQITALFFTLLALILKLGAAPFHLWFPQIMEGIMWPQAIILMTIQKLAPMFLLSYLLETSSTFLFILFSSMMSAILGSLGGINQVLLRKIMAYSSINHMAWMLSAMTISEKAWITYFIFYSMISMSVVLIFHFNKMNHLSQIINYIPSSNFIFFSIPLSLFSLGGLPPFSGFIPKWILIQTFSSNNMYIPLFILLISTLITLYFYTRIFITMIILTPNMKWLMKKNTIENFNMSLTLYFNMFMLIIPSMYMIF